MNGKKVVKRKGHYENFDEKKVYGSIYFACKSSHMHSTQCELIAERIVGRLKEEIRGKKEIDSDKIFGFVAKELEKQHKDAAYMYRTHRDIS